MDEPRGVESAVTAESKADAAQRRTGFTLIEVLASMGVLLILMLALVRMFDEASTALKKGTTSVSRSAAARAAMEMITQDLEGAVIDRRFQFYSETDTVDDNFDEIYFVTMKRDPEMGTEGDDGRSFQLVHYYVKIQTNTYAGARYLNFQLMRGAVDTDVVKKNTGVDVLSLTKPWGWWRLIPGGDWAPVKVADNIVRFDVYVHDDDGNLIGGGEKGAFDSRYKSNGYPINTPPAFIDVYMQVTSDEAMKMGGLDLISGLTAEGVSILYRESFLLTTRIHPTMASAQVAHPSQY